ncbi:hypothetical protein [Nocardia salmonicida]|uniref:hypothetical protein n=1 Tax=Nocardia salmonicida TaxID=53431 RepID=UPI001BDF171B|nr:hypothetical protein [Nocardia salmonicida]
MMDRLAQIEQELADLLTPPDELPVLEGDESATPRKPLPTQDGRIRDVLDEIEQLRQELADPTEDAEMAREQVVADLLARAELLQIEHRLEANRQEIAAEFDALERRDDDDDDPDGNGPTGADPTPGPSNSPSTPGTAHPNNSAPAAPVIPPMPPAPPMPPTPPQGPSSPDGGQPGGRSGRDGDPLRNLAEFFREQRDQPSQRSAEPLSGDAAEHARVLADALDLGAPFTTLREPLAALAELAELAGARGFLDSADGPRMRFPDDFGPLSDTQRYGDEQYWLSEAEDSTLREIQQDLRRAGLPVDEPAPPAPALPRSPDGAAILASSTDPDTAPSSTDRAPVPESVEQTRDRLVRQFDLTDTDLRQLGDTVANLRYRNLLRAGMVEAMAAATDRAAGIADPALRTQAEATRDDWARRLRIDPGALALDPARVVADARAAVRREALDIRDLADAVRCVEIRPDGAVDEAAARRYNFDIDGDHVPARLVADGESGWRVEEAERLDAPAATPRQTAADPTPRKSLLRRIGDAVFFQYVGHTPKYPSGSSLDSAGQSMLGHGAGLPLTSVKDPSSAPGDEYDLLTTKFNPARIIKEAVTMWRSRELVPFFKHLTSRIADRAAPDNRPPTTRDGDEYRYALDEADPDLVRRELGVELDDLKQQADEEARARELAAQQANPELAAGPPAEPPLPAGAEIARTTTEIVGWSNELADAVTVRDDLADTLIDAADDLEVTLGDPTPENVRRALDQIRYQQARRIGALTGLAEASRRFNAEHQRIPFSDEINFFDADPMTRFLNEVVRANDGSTTLLNWQGVNNGGEPGRAWGDMYYTDQPGLDQGIREYFENALRRDQIRDERAVWAQLLQVDLDALDSAQLRDLLVDEMARIREHDRLASDFARDAEAFLRAHGEAEELTGLIGDMACRDWVLSRGGAMLDDGTGIGLIPGESEGSMRLVVLEGDLGNDRVIADALRRYPDLAEAVNDGLVDVQYVGADVRPGRTLPDGQGQPPRILVLDGGTPQVRHYSGVLEGRSVDVTAVNDGSGWRVVPDEPADAVLAVDSADAAPEHVSRSEIDTAIGALVDRLGVTTADRASAATLADKLATLRAENAVRACRIEAIIDYARTAWDIDTFHQVESARHLVAHRLGVDATEMTPRRLAEEFADQRVRNPRRQQQAEALTDYVKLLRGIDAEAIDAANNRLVRRLDALWRTPGSDLPAVTGIGQLGDVVAALVHREGIRGELVDALTDYAAALAEADRFDPRAHGDRAVDPRVADTEFPVHDKAVRHLLDLVGDLSELLDQPANLGLLDGHTDIAPGPDRGPSRDFARTLGVDLTDADAQRWADVYEIYRDGKVDQDERLTPQQLAEVQAVLRDEVVQRAADITELADLLRRTADADMTRLAEERGTATRELTDAETVRTQARHGLPINEPDLLEPRARAAAIEELRTRTMPVDEQQAWQNRVSELERAAQRVDDARAELDRIDVEVDRLNQFTQPSALEAGGLTRSTPPPAEPLSNETAPNGADLGRDNGAGRRTSDGSTRSPSPVPPVHASDPSNPPPSNGTDLDGADPSRDNGSDRRAPDDSTGTPGAVPPVRTPDPSNPPPLPSGSQVRSHIPHPPKDYEFDLPVPPPYPPLPPLDFDVRPPAPTEPPQPPTPPTPPTPPEQPPAPPVPTPTPTPASPVSPVPTPTPTSPVPPVPTPTPAGAARTHGPDPVAAAELPGAVTAPGCTGAARAAVPSTTATPDPTGVPTATHPAEPARAASPWPVPDGAVSPELVPDVPESGGPIPDERQLPAGAWQLAGLRSRRCACDADPACPAGARTWWCRERVCRPELRTDDRARTGADRAPLRGIGGTHRVRSGHRSATGIVYHRSGPRRLR